MSRCQIVVASFEGLGTFHFCHCHLEQNQLKKRAADLCIIYSRRWLVKRILAGVFPGCAVAVPRIPDVIQSARARVHHTGYVASRNRLDGSLFEKGLYLCSNNGVVLGPLTEVTKNGGVKFRQSGAELARKRLGA